MDKIWRNDGDDVATFLWFYHAKHFMVFNLSGEEYDYAKFDNRVLDFGFPDHSACPLALLFQIVEAMKKWLSEDEENVAVAALKFFAEARSATAAGVLTPSQIRYAHYANEIYRGRIDPPFAKERPLVLKKIVISPFPVIPDADDVQRMGGWEPVIKVLTLQGHHKEKNNERLLYSSDYHPTKLYYSKPGNIRVVRWHRILCDAPVLRLCCVAATREVDNGTVNQEKERIRSKLKQREKIVVDITKGCFVRGDIQLKFFHQASSRISFARILKSGYLKPVEVLSTALSKKYPYICLFRLSFHTSFVGRQLNEIIAKQQRESGGGAVTTESMGESYDGGNGTVSWTLRKEELDAMFSGPAHTKMLPDDFAIKLVFGYPDASDDTPGLRSSTSPASSSSSSPSSSPSSSANASSMRGSGGSRSTPNLPPLPALPSVDGATSAVASLALSPRGPEQREKLAQRRTGDGRPNARATVNFSGGGKYKEAEHQPPSSRGQRGTISYSSIKRHATGPLQNERKAQERSIDFEDIFLKTPTPSSTASSRDHSEQRISESTEPTFPPASAMRRRSSLPSNSAQHAADAAAETAAVHKKSVTPSPPRPNPSARPDAPTQTRGSWQPPAERDVSPTHRVEIMTSTPALTSSLHSPLRPTPPSSSSSSSFSSLPQFSTSPPASMTPPGSGGSMSSNGQATAYAYPPSAIAAAAASHNRQSLLQSYPSTHPVLTPTPAGLVAPVSAPAHTAVPSPAHTAVLTPTPSLPAMGGGGPPPTHPHSAPAQFVAGAGDGSGSAQLHMPLTPVSVRPGASNPPQPQPLNNSSGVSPVRASMAVGHGHVPLQPTPATLGNGSGNSHGNGNVGQLPSYAHHPQQPQPQHQQHFFALHAPLQPVPVLHQDFTSRLPPVRFPPASSAQAIDEAQRERIRQQIIAERQRALYPQQPQTQPSQTQSQPQYHQPLQPERARDQSNANAANTINMERRRQQEDERTRRDSWERERAAAADRGRGRGGDDGGDDRDDRRDRGGGGRGGDGRGGGRGGGDGRPRGGARGGGGGSGNGGRGGQPPAASPRRTYHISEML
ncbi:Phosphatidylinositol-3,4,5-trisphosphate 3-phosphatase [Acanthamoeba castellanii str. Neff]|uniref:Phosphatidylinositol-3,4,5-trisphosphate 3-phosphatase n=1 Tax=Acanthamoeba castellanii (strain ATCC 30010 / Neff) TaxID=1257118 RepID=L8GR06_ACACF|nr:Phosphatidylinositol-3,4,5-trisphosphate 3-phosphatase [Acanthamoeba castellanii str. Neff]ELR15569.1 Phosphatidylinositol-3,4,5-trisphosphate 3-phosphatase [Acanthamoeba castellanii str. Neff]